MHFGSEYQNIANIILEWYALQRTEVINREQRHSTYPSSCPRDLSHAPAVNDQFGSSNQLSVTPNRKCESGQNRNPNNTMSLPGIKNPIKCHKEIHSRSISKGIELKPKRRQFIDIVIKSIDTKRILAQLKGGNTEGITVEELRKIVDIMPSPDEVHLFLTMNNTKPIPTNNCGRMSASYFSEFNALFKTKYQIQYIQSLGLNLIKKLLFVKVSISFCRQVKQVKDLKVKEETSLREAEQLFLLFDEFPTYRNYQVKSLWMIIMRSPDTGPHY